MGLLLRSGVAHQRWVPVKARFGWIPAACVQVQGPVTLQYSPLNLKFRLESPRIRLDPDGSFIAATENR